MDPATMPPWRPLRRHSKRPSAAAPGNLGRRPRSVVTPPASPCRRRGRSCGQPWKQSARRRTSGSESTPRGVRRRSAQRAGRRPPPASPGIDGPRDGVRDAGRPRGNRHGRLRLDLESGANTPAAGEGRLRGLEREEEEREREGEGREPRGGAPGRRADSRKSIEAAPRGPTRSVAPLPAFEGTSAEPIAVDGAREWGESRAAGAAALGGRLDLSCSFARPLVNLLTR